MSGSELPPPGPMALGVDIGGSGIKAAPVDVLTGRLMTKRQRIPTPRESTPDAVGEVVAQLAARFRWSGAVGCTFVGIDGMPRVRERLGEEGLDTLVQHVAGITRSVVRATDVVGRWREGMLVVVTHGAGAPMDVLEQRIATKLAQDCPVPADVWPRRLVLSA